MLKRAATLPSGRIVRGKTRKKVELNSAPAASIHQLPGLTENDAMECLRRRPFKSWENVETALSWNQEFIEKLRKSGARVDGQ